MFCISSNPSKGFIFNNILQEREPFLRLNQYQTRRRLSNQSNSKCLNMASSLDMWWNWKTHKSSVFLSIPYHLIKQVSTYVTSFYWVSIDLWKLGFDKVAPVFLWSLWALGNSFAKVAPCCLFFSCCLPNLATYAKMKRTLERYKLLKQ